MVFSPLQLALIVQISHCRSRFDFKRHAFVERLVQLVQALNASGLARIT